MAAIVWFFIKREMCGTALNVANTADYFKVSRSQLSWLLMAKKFKSGPRGYVPKKRTEAEGETSGATAREEQEQEQEGDEFEEYLLS